MGILMNHYKFYFLIGIKPYESRNAIMHKPWWYQDRLSLLQEGSSEIVKKLNSVIINLLDQSTNVKFENIELTSALFSDEQLSKAHESQISVDELKRFIRQQLKALAFIEQIASHISKKASSRLETCGILFHAMTACMCMLGKALEELKAQNNIYYRQIKQAICEYKFLKIKVPVIKNSGEKIRVTVTLYQYIRVQTGHFFNGLETNFEPLPQQRLYKACQDSAALLTKHEQLFLPAHANSASFFQPAPVLAEKEDLTAASKSWEDPGFSFTANRQ